MTYVKQTWHDDPTRDTPLNASRLSHMEDGIEGAHTTPTPPSRLGTGTPDTTTFLRGDSSWAVPPGGGGGTDLSAVGTYVAAITAWSGPGFVSNAANHAAGEWLALHADAFFASFAVGSGDGTNGYVNMRAGPGVAQLTAVADSGQTQPMLDAWNPSAVSVFKVMPNGAVVFGSVINTRVADYSLLLTDANQIVEMNLAGANNLTVPANASVAFPIGTRVDIVQIGAGQTTLVQGPGVTIRTPDTLKLAKQNASVSIYKRGTDEWVAMGNLALT